MPDLFIPSTRLFGGPTSIPASGSIKLDGSQGRRAQVVVQNLDAALNVELTNAAGDFIYRLRPLKDFTIETDDVIIISGAAGIGIRILEKFYYIGAGSSPEPASGPGIPGFGSPGVVSR